MIIWLLMTWQRSVRLPKLEPEKKKKARRRGGTPRVGDEEERQKVSQLPLLRSPTAETANH